MTQDLDQNQNAAEVLFENLSADAPLVDPRDDRLGYAPFAQNLADAICRQQTDESLVFALYGPWGSGKTTCLNFVLNYINERPEDDQALVVRFDPWWFSDHGDLLQSFFRELRIALGKVPKLRNAANGLANFSKLLSEVPEPTVGTLGKLLAPIMRWLSREKSVWQIRDDIRGYLAQQDRRILIVIDDIDRLTADEVRGLFKVVKAVADFPKITYLMAFDKAVVVKALKSVQDIPGDAYLEKIIQVPFEMPPPDKTALRQLFINELDSVLAGTPDEFLNQTYFGNVFWDGIDHFLTSMRDITRLINVLKVTYPALRAEVNAVDFIAIRTIECFLPEVYRLIQSSPDLFAGPTDTYGLTGSDAETVKAFHGKWVEALPENRRATVKDMLKRIFPKLESVFGNTHYGSNWTSSWRKQLRICSPDVFPIYFRLSLPAGEITHSEMKAILSLGPNAELFEKKLLELVHEHRADGGTRLRAFLERMEDFTEEDIPLEQIPTILQALFNIGDQLLAPEDEGRGLLGLGNDLHIGRIMFQLLKRYDNQQERFDLLKTAFSRGQAVSVITGEIITLGQQHGKNSDQKNSEDECLVSLKQQEELEIIGLQKIKEASAEEHKLLAAPNLAGILYAWRQWENEEAVKTWVGQAIKPDQGLADFLTGFLSKSSRQSISDRVARTFWTLKPKVVEPFVDPTAIAQRCSGLMKSPPEWMTERQELAIKTFLKGVELQETGEPERRWDWDE